jgi:phenylacetic acid degradation operon negative regulatory protein
MNPAELNERPSSTQFKIFTVLGTHLLPREGSIWTADLLYLLSLLGVSERATRSTLSRLVRKGWLVSCKEGRRSRYALTASGRALLEQGKKRIFELPFADWDEMWYLVIYSLPEDKRTQRHALRQHLIWQGFGRLAPGTWISAHNRQAELEAIFDELKVQAYVELFASAHLGPSSAQTLIQRCWDLPALEAEYKEFVARYQPEFAACQAQSDDELRASPETCFVRQFWVEHDFQPFPRKDPNLPMVLLPPDWVGFTARQLFDDYRQRLSPFSNEFIGMMVQSAV